MNLTKFIFTKIKFSGDADWSVDDKRSCNKFHSCYPGLYWLPKGVTAVVDQGPGSSKAILKSGLKKWSD